MPKRSKKAVGVALPAEIIKAVEVERVKDRRPSISNTVEVLLEEAIHARNLRRGTVERLPGEVIPELPQR